MGRLLTIIFVVLTLGLIAAGSIHKSSTAPASTPEGAVQSMFANVQGRNWKSAYAYVAASSNVDQGCVPRVYDKVPQLSEKIVLIDVPFLGTASATCVHV